MGRQTVRHLFILLFQLMLAISCVHSPKIEILSPDYSLLKREELSLLADTDQEACLEAVSVISISRSGEPGLDPNSLGNIATVAAERLAARLKAEMAAGKWKEAERSFASIQAILSQRSAIFSGAASTASASVSNDTVMEIFLGRAEEYLRSGLYAPAAAYLHKALDHFPRVSEGGGEAEHLDDTAMARWFAKAMEAADTETVRRILSLLTESQATKLGSTAGEPRVKDIGEKAAGVVTVYVDKGLKIKNGIGYPDRILGTAFQVDAIGYYITNYHVISSEVDPAYNGYSRLSIRPSANPYARIPAKVIGWDEDLDLALLKSLDVSSHTFYPFRPGKTAKGQRVYAIGSPVGLENSVTAGIVSATERRILPRGEAMQIDAPVNPGSSGGPLLDEEGDLAGIIFAGLSGFQGLNFALPVSWVSTVFPALFDGGKIQSSWIGVGLARNLDSSLDISYAFKGKSGLEAGDRLITIDGKRFQDIQGSQMFIAMKPIGSLCALEIERKGERIILLRKTGPIPQKPFKKASRLDTAELLLGGATGMLLEHVSGPRGIGGTYKVLSTWPGMPADESGIGQADLIKFLHYAVDNRTDSIYFDVSVKSLNSGYLERMMRMNLSLETNNFL